MIGLAFGSCGWQNGSVTRLAIENSELMADVYGVVSWPA
jgi:hypothetical protein